MVKKMDELLLLFYFIPDYNGLINYSSTGKASELAAILIAEY
jgi:hypothetical protein